MQYLPIQPNLGLKTRPKQLLGSLPLDIALSDLGRYGAGLEAACSIKNVIGRYDTLHNGIQHKSVVMLSVIFHL